MGSHSTPLPRRIAFIGTYTPRRCGIATFTSDLLQAVAARAPDTECWATVMNDVVEGYSYPAQVRFELNWKDPADYRLAAEFLNMNHVDAVCLQHEFGIFGGRHGAYILELLQNLRVPVVTTLHTVLRETDPARTAVVEKLAALSDRLVVMSKRGAELLRDVYHVDDAKIAMIPHGVPDMPFLDASFHKGQFGVEGKKVLLTFGLLSPGKGIEHMIDALPRIVAAHPNVTYIVLGATHPHVKRDQGEAYRQELQRRARTLGVEEHIFFHNRFVDLKTLCEFLGAADVYITPYLNQEQIVSGTLAYALGAGKATISTPYWYAQEMLADGRGRLVPLGDAGALADQVIDLLDNETERDAMRKRAYMFCREMVWPQVARQYLDLFVAVTTQRESHPVVLARAQSLQTPAFELPRPRLDHLYVMTDDVGILQHANFAVPNRSEGYCTDDNARALITVLMAPEAVEDQDRPHEFAYRYLSFLQHAFNEANGRFRNFMSYDRKWLDDEGSEDSHARAIWALGETVLLSKSDGLVGVAMTVFERALPALSGFVSPRAWALALIGIDSYLQRFGGDSVTRRIRGELTAKLWALFESNATDDWPWPEQHLTYANATLPQALLLSGRYFDRPDMIAVAIRALRWVARLQTDPHGHFVPIGNDGWYVRDSRRARFDQQPIEAQHMIDACIDAYQISNDSRWLTEVRRSFEWFLGRNDLQLALHDYRTGGCRDGLSAQGINQNQGAESTLAWLHALFNLHGAVASSIASSESIVTPSVVPLLQPQPATPAEFAA